MDSRDDFQHTLTARGHWRSDNRSNHRWGRRIDLLGSDAVLSDEDSCESLLRKRRITNHACVHDAIFTGTSGKSAPNRDKCRLWSTVGDRSARHFSAYLTRIISKYSWAQHCLIDPRIFWFFQRRQGTGLSVLSQHTSNGHKEVSYLRSGDLTHFNPWKIAENTSDSILESSSQPIPTPRQLENG